MVLRFCGMDNLLVPDHRIFDAKIVRHSVTIKKGSKIIDMIRLDMPKVLFVSKEIEDPVALLFPFFSPAYGQRHEDCRDGPKIQENHAGNPPEHDD